MATDNGQGEIEVLRRQLALSRAHYQGQLAAARAEARVLKHEHAARVAMLKDALTQVSQESIDWLTEPLASVLTERARQDAKWGRQQHPPGAWLAILVEEVGELAREILQSGRGVRDEAVQVAAVALALIEYLDQQIESGEKEP